MAAKSLCSIPACGKPARTRGWCNAHYLRQWKHGDVNADVPLAEKGEPERFFEEIILKHDGDQCLIWPFAKTPAGYGKMWRDGRLSHVSRLLCIEVNGEPPAPNSEAAHSCGKGHLGCVAKRHVRWATPSENAADKAVHGTLLYGERSPVAKLVQSDVDRIFDMKASGVKQIRIARAVGISPAQVCRILQGKNWQQQDKRRKAADRQAA